MYSPVTISNVQYKFMRGDYMLKGRDVIDDFQRGRLAPGSVVVIVRDIPVEDLVPAPAHMNTWQLRDGSDTAGLCAWVGGSCGVIPITAQRRVEDGSSFDADGKRLPANHDLLLVVPETKGSLF